MKTYLLSIAILLSATVSAQTAGKKLIVDTTASSIKWKGSKIGGDHTGTIGIKSGELIVNGQEVVSGYFIIDMNNILNEDLLDQKTKDMLVNHLKSVDFFDVAKYPESTFTITKVDVLSAQNGDVNISGNLKMKDVEKGVTFKAKITKDGDVYKAVTVPFNIDRTQWNVRYGSKTIFKELTDNVISDNIELQITIVAKEVK